jgi:hypothetical protein
MTDSSVRAEASRLLEKITPGEWSLHGAQGDFTVLGPDVQRIASLDARDRPESMQNAEFIVKAPRLLRALLAEGPELCLCGTHPAENACMKLASDGKLADGYRCRRELTRPDPETITQLQQFIIEMHGAAAGCPPQGSLRALITSWRDGLSDLLAGLAASQENGK